MFVMNGICKIQLNDTFCQVERLAESSGGCYLPSAMQREVDERVREKEHELQRRYSLQEEELVCPDHSTLTQTTWNKEETWEESGRRGKIRVRSMGPSTGRMVSQQLVNGLHSQSWYDDSPAGLKQKSSSFKLSKGATPQFFLIIVVSLHGPDLSHFL